MSKSKIEWTEQVWNPLAGCSKVSAGCEHCYAIGEAWKKMHHPNPKISGKYAGTVKKTEQGKLNWTGKINFSESALLLPLKVKKPTRWFINSMSDLFHENADPAWRDSVLTVMSLTPHHIYQSLTKRASVMHSVMNNTTLKNRVYARRDVNAVRMGIKNLNEFEWPLPNLWLGVSVEDDKQKDRIDLLLRTPAAVRFLSCEPLLGPIILNRTPVADYGGFRNSLTGKIVLGPEDKFVGLDELPKIDWVIAGGESGPDARPMHPDWARSLRDQCMAAGVPFFFKQWGEWIPGSQTSRADGTFCIINKEGQKLNATQIMTENHDQTLIVKNGKKKNGNLLDGVKYLEFPEVKEVENV